MSKKARKILVTSALPYANGSIHLGHLLEYIQTDIWVRYQKAQGHECIYVCADDTHGTAIMLKAQSLNILPETLIEQVKKEHERDFSSFHIQFDCYHSTHSDENRMLAEKVFTLNKAGGYIISKNIMQLYDATQNMFLADRYVKGECPKCHAKDQYGDNCEGCGATYSAKELINPVSVLSNTPPIEKENEQLFFDLPQFQNMLSEWLDSDSLQSEVANKLKEWLKEGLQPWDISREEPYFGFKIPGYDTKYFYVWLDAPIGYMASFEKYCQTHPGTQFNDYWNENSQAELYHFIGKDIINFHGLFWPAMLTGSQYRKPTGIFAHGFLTVNGTKMSKSRGTFIQASTYLEYLNPEYLRYYFAAKLTSKVEDLDLNLEDFSLRVNADLVGKLVNIASRSQSFIHKYFQGQLSLENGAPYLIGELLQKKETIEQYYEQREFSKAMKEIMQLADTANKYIDDQKPWEMAKNESERQMQSQLHKTVTAGINCFRLLTIYLSPVLPQMTEKAKNFLNVSCLQWGETKRILLDHTLNAFEPLMVRIDPQQIEKMIDASKEALQGIKTPPPAKKSEPAKKSMPTTKENIPPVTGTIEKPSLIDYEQFSKVDLRIAKIEHAENVEGSDKLLKLTLSLGDETRTVFSGIKEKYQAESLIGRHTLMVANLAPRKMRFGISEGMVLAAGEGKDEIFLLSPDEGAVAGMKVK